MSKATTVIEARVDIRDLAMALSYIQGEGYRPRSKAETVTLCVKAVAALAQGNIDRVEDALHLLQEAFGASVKLGRRGSADQLGAALRSALQAETLEEERAPVEKLSDAALLDIIKQFKP